MGQCEGGGGDSGCVRHLPGECRVGSRKIVDCLANWKSFGPEYTRGLVGFVGGKNGRGEEDDKEHGGGAGPALQPRCLKDIRASASSFQWSTPNEPPGDTPCV